MYKENSLGGYDEYTSSNTFPTSGYVLNEDLSKCYDSNNVEIENALSYIDNAVVVKGNKSLNCTLYFSYSETIYETPSTPTITASDSKSSDTWHTENSINI